MNAVLAKKELHSHIRRGKAEVLSRFFKTGKGQYGEGDVFLGVMVPETRKTAKAFKGIVFSEIKKLLDSKYHEERLLGVLILVEKFMIGTETEKEKIYKFYLRNIRQINNWDLVDLSAPKIVGGYLNKKDKKILVKFANSRNLWERRISILSTLHFINKNNYSETLKIAEILLGDKHDLIHKAVGWMLREVGKKSLSAEEDFLAKNHLKMPRTMLRYAIERFPTHKRVKYLMKKPPKIGG